MGYNNDIIEKFLIMLNEINHLFQEGVILSLEEKEKILKIIKDIELLIKTFDTD